jgi:isoleucyl-tRNA synthetase
MTRWIAPILSFTAEEIWAELPGDHDKTVFVSTWYDGLTTLDESTEMNSAYWAKMMEVRSAVSKQLEGLRNDKVIKGSLTAEVTLFADDQLFADINKLGEELRFVLITSGAEIKPMADKADNAVESEMAGLWIAAGATEHAKCARCWHHREEVGSIEGHEDLCQRCVDNTEGEGETRHYA